MRAHIWEHVDGKMSSYERCRRCGITAGHAIKEFCSVTWKTEYLHLPGSPVNPGVKDCDYELVRSVMES